MDDSVEKTQIDENLVQVEKPVEIVKPVEVDVEKQRQFEEIKDKLLNPRTISKTHDPEGRLNTFLSGTEAKDQIVSNLDVLAQAKKQKTVLYEEYNKKLHEKKDAESSLEKRKGSLWVKIEGVLKIEDKTVTENEKTIEEINNSILEIREKAYNVELSKSKAEKEGPNISTPKEVLDAYYEKIAETPLSDEEKREYLKPEFLASLDEKEYVALWKRLNPNFLAHTTRQGFRDHFAMDYHSEGVGNYFGGMDNITADNGLLRSALGARGLTDMSEETIEKFVEESIISENDTDPEKVKYRLEKLFENNGIDGKAPAFPDRTAVHMTAEAVGNKIYGGENENEVFFVFPTDCLASQNNFALNGWEKDFTKPQDELKWNDVFVWPKESENNGISINSGIAFLPESTMVDPETGSKYASEVKVIDGKEVRIRAEDTVAVNNAKEWIKSLMDPDSAVMTAFREISKGSGTSEYVNAIMMKEITSLGIGEDKAVKLANMVMSRLSWTELSDDKQIDNLIQSSGVQWKEPENPIPAKEYWEKKFAESPEKRPKHVTYYDGNPTNAVYRFLVDMGISGEEGRNTGGKLLGFDDHHVENMESDERVNEGREELIEKGKRAIDEHFRSAKLTT